MAELVRPRRQSHSERDGWFSIIWHLCSDLEPLVAELEREPGERFEVVQVKQKFGTLRSYVSHHTDTIDGCIEEAALEASRTCEVCDRGGRQREPGGSLACDELAEGMAINLRCLRVEKAKRKCNAVHGP